MIDQFGMPMVDCRPAHEVITELRQQVATLQELKQAWHDKFWEQSKETNQLRQQLAELLDWQQKAFAAHPNIDIDIDRLNGGN